MKTVLHPSKSKTRTRTQGKAELGSERHLIEVLQCLLDFRAVAFDVTGLVWSEAVEKHFEESGVHFIGTLLHEASSIQLIVR